MRYIALKSRLSAFLVFSVADVRKLDANFDIRRISEWLARGLIKRVRRGFYIFADAPLTDEATLVIAGRIYAPSYISYETALARYGIIPEAVFGVTSATTLKTKKFETPVGNFIYRNLKPALLFGYHVNSSGGQPYQLADLEKALLDCLRARPELQSEAGFREARLNVEQLMTRLNRPRFSEYVARFKNKALARRARNFLSYLDHVEH